jgi:hypothetical protein
MDAHPSRSFPIVDGGGAAAEDFPAELFVSQLKQSGAVILRDTAGGKESFIALTNRLAPGMERGVAPGEAGLGFHGEIYYTPWPPDILWFYCLCPAETDGQTLLCDGVELANLMDPESRKFFLDTPLVYEMAWAHEIWSPYFNTQDHDQVLDYLKAWPSITATFTGDLMRTRFTTWAIQKTKWGGEPAFINSLLHALDDVWGPEIGNYGLRTEIPSAIVSRLRDLAATLAFWIEWRRGDIVMIDNTRVMHARRPFGGNREIIAVNGTALF